MTKKCARCFTPAMIASASPKLVLGLDPSINLSMAWGMRRRHEHLPVAPFANVILDDGLTSREAMLVAKTLEYPLRRVPLLAVNRPVLHQNTIDDIRERVQLRTFRRSAAPIAWRNRMRRYLGYCLAVDTEPPGRLSLAQSLSITRQPHTTI